MVCIAVARLHAMRVLTRMDQLRSCEFQEDIDAITAGVMDELVRIRRETRMLQRRSRLKPSVKTFSGFS